MSITNEMIYPSFLFDKCKTEILSCRTRNLILTNFHDRTCFVFLVGPSRPHVSYDRTLRHDASRRVEKTRRNVNERVYKSASVPRRANKLGRFWHTAEKSAFSLFHSLGSVLLLSPSPSPQSPFFSPFSRASWTFASSKCQVTNGPATE